MIRNFEYSIYSKEHTPTHPVLNIEYLIQNMKYFIQNFECSLYSNYCEKNTLFSPPVQNFEYSFKILNIQFIQKILKKLPSPPIQNIEYFVQNFKYSIYSKKIQKNTLLSLSLQNIE